MCDKCKHCECSCECEIDCSRPEDYELKRRGCPAVPVIALIKGQGITGKRYHVVYEQEDGTFSMTLCEYDAKHRIRKKKKWEPEPGKYYLFSDYKNELDTNHGFLREFIRVEEDGYYLARGNPEDVRWLYCWSVDKDTLGD